jgi:hypothetical protein
MIPAMMAAFIALLSGLFFAPEMTTNVGEVANLTVRWDQHGVSIVRVERALLPRPAPLLRYRGRFEARAVDTAHGADKTLDFVRFDFPLMAPAESRDEMTAEAQAFGDKLRANVTATTIVRVPLPRGATAISVYDTASHKAVSVSLASGSSPTTTTPPARAPERPAAGGSTKR